MKTVFISGPYSLGDPVVNSRKAIIMAEKLSKHGFSSYIPHLNLFRHFLFPHDIDFWYQDDIIWLKKCDYIIRLPGKSRGADEEERWAKEWKIESIKIEEIQ